QAVIDVDPVGCDTERGEGVALRGEILFVGGDPGVADQQSAHPGSVPVDIPSSGISPGGSYGNRRAAPTFDGPMRRGCPGGGSPYDANAKPRVGGRSPSCRANTAVGCQASEGRPQAAIQGREDV